MKQKGNEELPLKEISNCFVKLLPLYNQGYEYSLNNHL